MNSFNATTGCLGGAVLALLTGHPLVAVGLAAPAAHQRISAQILTSKRLLSWLARALRKPNPQAAQAHLARLTAIAKAEPSIANDVLQLQQRLSSFVTGTAPAKVAADEGGDPSLDVQPPEQQNEEQAEHALP